VVNQGLNSDDRVIVSGLQRVRPGVVVTPKPAEEPANTGVAQTKDLGTQ
jgi:multidrug efflux system membrane fusion protein